MTLVSLDKKLDKRQRIIKAATKVFADFGFFNAKISQIAQIAGVADGTIYLYFKSKDDLLITIFEEEMSKVIELQISRLKTSTTAIDKLITFAKNHAFIVTENFDLAAFIQVEIRQSSKFMKDYKNKQFANYLNMIAEIIESGVKSGDFVKDLNVNLAKHSFFGAIDEISTQWVLLNESKRFNLESSLIAFTQIFLRGIKR
jgi:TetR/AcrR family fatty acid metabolism transcriptional regulator